MKIPLAFPRVSTSNISAIRDPPAGRKAASLNADYKREIEYILTIINNRMGLAGLRMGASEAGCKVWDWSMGSLKQDSPFPRSAYVREALYSRVVSLIGD